MQSNWLISKNKISVIDQNVTNISKIELYNAKYQGQVTNRCTQLSTTLAETEQHDEAQGANLSTRQR